jgi:hypothetical protein
VSSTPGHLAVELEPHRRSAEQLQEITLGLHRMANALAQVDTEPAAQAALGGELAALRVADIGRKEWSRAMGVQPRYVAALACAAVAALVAAPRAEAPRVPTPHPVSAVQLGPVGAILPVATAPMLPAWASLALDMPPGPFRGQVRPNANGKCERRADRVINGGCWVRLGDLAPPCEKDAYEWKGGCYLPTWPAPREDPARRP